MGRRSKFVRQAVSPVSSKKQTLMIAGVCEFLGGISADSLAKLRSDPAERFPRPLQMLGNTPMWTVEQLERYVARKEKEVEAIAS